MPKTPQDFAREFADWFYIGYNDFFLCQRLKEDAPTWARQLCKASHGAWPEDDDYSYGSVDQPGSPRPDNSPDVDMCVTIGRFLAERDPAEWDKSWRDMEHELAPYDLHSLSVWLSRCPGAVELVDQAQVNKGKWKGVIDAMQAGQWDWISAIASLLIREFRRLAEAGE